MWEYITYRAIILKIITFQHFKFYLKHSNVYFYEWVRGIEAIK